MKLLVRTSKRQLLKRKAETALFEEVTTPYSHTNKA